MKNKNPQIEVHKRDSETTSSLMRRFSRKVQQSGLLKRVRAIQYRERPKSRKRVRDLAIRKKKYAEHMRYMKKLGKIKDKDK